MNKKEYQIMLLQLAAAQLSLSLQETEQPFNRITQSFITIAENNHQIDKQLLSNTQTNTKQLSSLCKKNQEIIQQSIIDFQFYDRTKQRLMHILNSLQQAIKTLNDNENDTEKQWQTVFNTIEKSYTMREETELYQAVQQNKGVDQAIKQLIKKTKTSSENPDVELF